MFNCLVTSKLNECNGKWTFHSEMEEPQTNFLPCAIYSLPQGEPYVVSTSEYNININ